MNSEEFRQHHLYHYGSLPETPGMELERLERERRRADRRARIRRLLHV